LALMASLVVCGTLRFRRATMSLEIPALPSLPPTPPQPPMLSTPQLLPHTPAPSAAAESPLAWSDVLVRADDSTLPSTTPAGTWCSGDTNGHVPCGTVVGSPVVGHGAPPPLHLIPCGTVFGSLVARCSVLGRILHSRMPLVPMPARLHRSRVATYLPFDTVNVTTLKGC
jgi:hypothetical protein